MQRTPFAEIAKHYRVLFLDSYGVLKNAHGLFPGVGHWLASLEIPFWIVTNDASIPPEQIAKRHEVAVDRIISCGDALSEHLAAAHRGARVGYLGREESEHYIRVAGAIPVRLDQSDAFDAFALMDEDGFDWQTTLDRVVNVLRNKPDIPLYLPNPDLLFSRDANSVGIGPGAVALLLEKCLAVSEPNRGFKTFGKPSRELFELALKRARKAIQDLKPAEVLMVGDTLSTDIAGAQNAGLASCLVLTGNTSQQRLETWIRDGEQAPDWVVGSILN